MAQGFAFGTGSAVARAAVGSMFGGSSGGSKEEAPAAPAPEAPSPYAPSSSGYDSCEVDTKAFMNCINENNGSSTNCDFYYTAMQACKSRN